MPEVPQDPPQATDSQEPAKQWLLLWKSKTCDICVLHANVKFKRVLVSWHRDCFTEFRDTFFATRTCGTTHKIPTLHHTYQESEWEAVARILASGWLRFGFLPIQLAPPFVKEALSLPSPETSLMEVFFNYISPTEKDVLSEALQDFQSADMDEVLSVVSSHSCTWKQSPEDTGRKYT